MKEETKIWFEQAEEHYSDAMFMYENSRYSGSVFFCHQALEKVLKAAIVEFANEAAPKSHALEHLLSLSKIKPLEKKWSNDLAEITRHFWRVRYGDYRKIQIYFKRKS